VLGEGDERAAEVPVSHDSAERHAGAVRQLLAVVDDRCADWSAELWDISVNLTPS
jgi:hypothetical protein